MSPAWFSLWGCNSPPPFRQVLPSNVKLRVLRVSPRGRIGEGSKLPLSLSRFTADFNSAENLHTLPKFTRCIARGIPVLTLHSVIYFLPTIRDYESFQSWREGEGWNYAFWLKFNALFAQCSRGLRCIVDGKRQEGGKKGKKERKKALRDLKGKGGWLWIVEEFMRRFFEYVLREISNFSPFSDPLDIYICISTFTSKFVWTSWGGNFGKSLEVNFSPWNANWIVTFSNWLFPRPIWFFFFLANFDHFKNIFFFFFPWSLTELSRIDRKGDVIMIGKTRREDFSSSSDLLFIRVLIIRGRRGKEPRLFHFY